MEGKTWQKSVYLSERVCGICSYIHTQTFTETFEKIAGEEAPLRAQFLRVISNELDRIQSHLLGQFNLLQRYRTRNSFHVHVVHERNGNGCY